MFALSLSLQHALQLLSKSVGTALVTFKMCGMRSDTAKLMFLQTIIMYCVLFFSKKFYKNKYCRYNIFHLILLFKHLA